MLGDRIAAALRAVGVTEERVTAWLGRPCGCKERRERLNALDAWARRVVGGKLTAAARWLRGIMEED